MTSFLWIYEPRSPHRAVKGAIVGEKFGTRDVSAAYAVAADRTEAVVRLRRRIGRRVDPERVHLALRNTLGPDGVALDTSSKEPERRRARQLRAERDRLQREELADLR